jgi:hypothetical protein
MDMPKPTDAHRQLEKLAGSWVGDETIYPSPMDPQGGTATSRMTAKVVVDGFALVSDYHQERGGVVTYRGHGIFTYEPQSSEYVMYWVDSIGSPGETFRGRLDGSMLALTSRGPMGSFRLSYDLGTPGRLKSRMEMSQDGMNWQPFFDSSFVPHPPSKPPTAKKKPVAKPMAKRPAKKAPKPAPKKPMKMKKAAKAGKRRR